MRSWGGLSRFAHLLVRGSPPPSPVEARHVARALPAWRRDYAFVGCSQRRRVVEVLIGVLAWGVQWRPRELWRRTHRWLC